MAHRKLQQEVDKVFKKINEGLEIFDTYYERRENCTNNPSQKEKLESDLKREVKKLQRLREQIKSWQSSPEIKDKDSLLDYRRSVEIAMEKYKAVEKASKEKAYSNNSLKKSENLDPEEQERRDVSDYLSQQIDELERQHEILQTEIDKLLLLNKKKKTATTANNDKKEALKLLQGRYRWHEQQMELALRLLANEELDPQDVNDIKDDINYFVESNQDPDFLEDESIYDNLNLQSNEAIAHEVAQSFAAQMADEQEEAYGSTDKDVSKLSKKEVRKLEREARKAAKEAAKASPAQIEDTSIENASSVELKSSSPIVVDNEPPSYSKSLSPSPAASITNPVMTGNSSSVATAPSTARSSDLSNLPSLKSVPALSSTPSNPTSEPQGHQHIHSHNGITTTSTLKPATVPIRPAGELKWAAAASQAMEKSKKPVLPSLPIINNPAVVSNINQPTTRPKSSTPAMSTPLLNQQIEMTGGLTSVTNSSLLESDNLDQSTEKEMSIQSKESLLKNDLIKLNSNRDDIIYDDYVSDVTDDELEPEELTPELLNDAELLDRNARLNLVKDVYGKNYDILSLPSGIQEYFMGRVIHDNQLYPLDGKLGGYRKSFDAISIPRLHTLPIGVNPPTPLDAFKGTHQWDIVRSSIGKINSNIGTSETQELLLEKFRTLDMFTLFYNYYFSVTSLEREIAARILVERNWKQMNNRIMWFLRQGDVKFANENGEVGDYKIFKADDWTVIEKLNFNLDHTSLIDPISGLSLGVTATSGDSDSSDRLSHGQQLLQQLNRGKSST